MRKVLIVILIVTSTCLYSCKDATKKDVYRIVADWQGKEVIFPDDIVFTHFGQDTVQYQIPESDYKILLYVDSVGCTSCKLQLNKWKEFIAEIDSLTSETVPVLLFFHPKDKRELAYLLKRDNLAVPVCFDETDKLNSLNQFPSLEDFQCFLLDKDNRVVYIGNPVHNIKIKEMYLSLINPNTHSNNTTSAKQTIIHVDQTEFDLGTLKQGEPVTFTARLKNKGDSPLIIYDTRASCGCTNIDYNKKPVLPDATLEINITYNAEDEGHFNRSVYIYGNMDNSPLTIKMKGNTN